MVFKMNQNLKRKKYEDNLSKINKLHRKKLRIFVVGPHRCGKSSFIQTFINFQFDFQKVTTLECREISKARKLIGDTEFEVEFIENLGPYQKDWADSIAEEIKQRFEATQKLKAKRKTDNFGVWDQGHHDQNVS